MEQRICPTCHTLFSPKEASQTFCNRACYEASRAKPVKICRHCGKPFPPGQQGRYYCSAKCRQEAGWMPPDPSKKETRVCLWCGKEFTAWVYRPTQYCSRLCSSHSGAGHPHPTAQRPESYITVICEVCSKPFTAHKRFFTREGHNPPQYCSKECRYTAHSIETRGEGNPNWRGGTTIHLIDYGPNWGRQKRRTKARDHHTCQACGYISGGDRFLDVHHIKPCHTFNGDWRMANRLINLICLCRPCHAAIDAGKMECPTPRGAVAKNL